MDQFVAAPFILTWSGVFAIIRRLIHALEAIMRKNVIFFAALFLLVATLPVHAAQLKVFVSELHAVGAPNKDEIKSTLQMLLASRLNGDRILSVSGAGEADVIVSGTYVAIGKVFSVDALAKTNAGKTVARAFVQGESQDELIPALGKLAEKMTAELTKVYFSGTTEAAVSVSPVGPAVRPEFIRQEKQVVTAVPASDFIKPQAYEHGSASGWISKRISGAANLMAVGKSLADGGHEIFLAEDQRVSFYRQGAEMKLVSEVEFHTTEKIISLDAMETPQGTEVYVTIIRNGDASSQVLQVQGDKLIKVAESLPYLFRYARIAGGNPKLLAQGLGRDGNAFGDVYEASRSGASMVLKSALKLPRYGNIYNFNRFRDHSGALFTVVINPDNYLVVYNEEPVEVWRSSDKFGGSELYYQIEDLDNVRVTNDRYRWIFLDQKLQVTSRGDLLVGKNEGFFVLGNARSYKKGLIYCFNWNGSSLEEKWRTRDTQNYMPDYFYDEARNELMILQTVQREGMKRGASSLSIKKVE